MSVWIGLPDEITEDHFSIVYKITNNVTNIKYIGKKQLWSTIKKPPLKGKLRKRKVIKPSKYNDYYGSSKQLQKDLITYGKENFKREVLDIATCKWEASFLELMWQLKENVINSDEYLNGIINIRLGIVPKDLREKYKKFKVDFSFDDDIVNS